jgi:hypothetical protein
MSNDDKVFSVIAGITVVIALCFFCIWIPKRNEFKAICEKMGGIVYQPYKAQPLCIRPDSIFDIKLE